MSNGPRSIGIIMDGNRRWAKSQGMSTLQGHQAGAEKIFDVARWAHEAGVEEVILYAFSTENWNRSEEEVGHLMRIAEHLFSRQVDRLQDSGARIQFIGGRTRMGTRMEEIMSAAEEKTRHGDKGTLVFALSYGGRSEILAAVNALVAKGQGEVTEQHFSNALSTTGLLDPDLILRTGGERRLSNFLPWQAIYSELFFLDTLWPDLSEREFAGVLREYAERDRRHGK